MWKLRVWNSTLWPMYTLLFYYCDRKIRRLIENIGERLKLHKKWKDEISFLKISPNLISSCVEPLENIISILSEVRIHRSRILAKDTKFPRQFTRIIRNKIDEFSWQCQFERAINSECHLHLAEVDCCRRVNELRFRFKFRKVGLAERR